MRKDTVETRVLYFTIVLALVLIIGSVIYYRCYIGTVPSTNPQDLSPFADFLGVFINLANLIIVSALTWFIYANNSKKDRLAEKERQEKYKEQKLKYLLHLIKYSNDYFKTAIDGLVQVAQSMKENPGCQLQRYSRETRNEVDILYKKIDQEEYSWIYYETFSSYQVLPEIFYYGNALNESLDNTFEGYSERMSYTSNEFEKFKNDYQELIKMIRRLEGNEFNHSIDEDKEKLLFPIKEYNHSNHLIDIEKIKVVLQKVSTVLSRIENLQREEKEKLKSSIDDLSIKGIELSNAISRYGNQLVEEISSCEDIYNRLKKDENTIISSITSRVNT